MIYLRVPNDLELLDNGCLRYQDDHGRWQLFCRISMCSDEVRDFVAELIRKNAPNERDPERS